MKTTHDHASFVMAIISKQENVAQFVSLTLSSLNSLSKDNSFYGLLPEWLEQLRIEAFVQQAVDITFHPSSQNTAFEALESFDPRG